MSGNYSPYVIFTDWVEMMAIAIQNGCWVIHNKLWEDREKRYLDIIGKYNKEQQYIFGRMFQMLIETFENNLTDLLGEIYMESGAGNKGTGQFFTPFHVSELTAEVAILKDVSEEKPLIINEPSCGGGGMIIAVAKILKKRGLNYQRCMNVVAQDLDWNSVYMTYVQLSLLGIKAVVVQGDTLAEPYTKKFPHEKVLWTPAKLGALM